MDFNRKPSSMSTVCSALRRDPADDERERQGKAAALSFDKRPTRHRFEMITVLSGRELYS